MFEVYSDGGLAGREGRAFVIRVDNRTRVTYAVVTSAVRAQASKVKRMPFEKSPAHADALRQSLTTRKR
jgi:hypothetical protein